MRFANGVFGLDDVSKLLLQGGSRTRSLLAIGPIVSLDALRHHVGILRQRVRSERKDLWTVFEAELKSLVSRQVEMRDRVSKAAVRRAIDKEIAKAQADVLREARRYLSLADDSDTSARHVVEGGSAHAQLLYGPEGSALLATLRKLRRPQAVAREARNDYLAVSGLALAADLSPLMSLIGTTTGMLLTLPLQAVRPGTATVRDVAEHFAQVTADFQAAFSAATVRYPLVFRLIDYADRGDVDLGLIATQILQDAWQAGKELQQKLNDDSDLVWKLPQLIERTVRFDFQADADFAQRIAADALTERDAEISSIQAFNYLIQAADTAFIAAPLPPLQLALIICSAIGSLAELVESYLKSEEQRLASRASIDPSRALSASPSFLGLVVQAVFVALSILPIPGAARELSLTRKPLA